MEKIELEFDSKFIIPRTNFRKSFPSSQGMQRIED